MSNMQHFIYVADHLVTIYLCELFSIVTISEKGDRLIFSNHDSKTRSFYIMTKTLKNNFSIKCEVPF